MEEEYDANMVREGLMASRREIFSISGPIHLTSIDWNNSYHRTSVPSCLVQAVYTLERDRQQNRIGLKSQAHHWWEYFNFTLPESLVDQSDGSIYGAVFKYKHFSNNHHNSLHSKQPPSHVIAFRGTIMKPDSRKRDLKLDLRCLRDSLQDSTRFAHAIEVVQRVVAKNGNTTVWLAGHSLGAAVALLTGKSMTKSGYPLECYLFNPLFSSIPLDKLVKSETVKHGVRFAGSVVKAGVAMAVKGHHHHKSQEDDSFMKLATWIPYLYLNPADPICSEYIGYFKHRNKMFETTGRGKIERIATRNSVKSLIFGGGGSSCSDSSSEPLHLLPSAYMTINTCKSPDFKSAHGIHQWWDPKFVGDYVLHQFNNQ